MSFLSPNIMQVIKSRRNRWAGHVVRMEKGCIEFWWGTWRRERPLGRPRHRWEVNIRIDLQEFGLGHEVYLAGSG